MRYLGCAASFLKGDVTIISFRAVGRSHTLRGPKQVPKQEFV